MRDGERASLCGEKFLPLGGGGAESRSQIGFLEGIKLFDDKCRAKVL